jgi:hypothetical protein
MQVVTGDRFSVPFDLFPSEYHVLKIGQQTYGGYEGYQDKYASEDDVHGYRFNID